MKHGATIFLSYLRFLNNNIPPFNLFLFINIKGDFDKFNQ